MNWRTVIFLCLIFALSLVLRCALFFYFTRHGANSWIPFDSEQYHRIACNIVAGHGICFDVGIPQFYRLPGYPLFLSLWYWCGGVNLAILVQLVLASLIPLLVFSLSLVLFPSQQFLAKMAALVACFHPGLILYAGMLATESLSLLLLLLFYIFFFRAICLHGFSKQQFFIAGIFLGLASLIRPIGHYVLALTILLILLLGYGWKAKIGGSVSVCIGWIIAVAPWLIRNFFLTGALFFHTLPGLHFIQYVAAPIIQQRDNCSYVDARKDVIAEWNDQIVMSEKRLTRPLNDYERCCCGERLALWYIIHYPHYAMKHAVTEMFKTCVGLSSAIILLADGASWPDYGSHITWWQKIKRFLAPSVRRPWLVPFIYLDIFFTLMLTFCFLFMMVFMLYGYCSWRTVLLIVPFMVLFVVLTLAYGGARLRLPIEPLLIIGAVCGWVCVARRMGWMSVDANDHIG